MTYALRLSDDELARYRMMAQRAQAQEADLWELAGLTPSTPDADELQARYLQWHAGQGNDLRSGRRLAALGRSAGLTIEAFRGWFEIAERPPGMRGPAWAAREAMVHSGLATEDDVGRWAATFDEIDSWTERPQFVLGAFAAVCRRPLEPACTS